MANTTTDSVRIERIIDAPAERVFRAFTNPEDLKQWFGEGETKTTYVEADARPDGRYLLVMQPPGGDPMHIAGTYREVDPPRRLVFTWQWERGVPDPNEYVITVELRRMGSRTAVSVTHAGLTPESATDLYRTGWEGGLERMSRLLAREVEG